MTIASGTTGGTGGGTAVGVPPELRAEQFRLCSALVCAVTICCSSDYITGGTTALICAHTPPYPPARERPEGRRAGRGACARARFMFHGSSAASVRRDGGGNGRAFGHSLFCVSGFPARTAPPGRTRAERFVGSRNPPPRPKGRDLTQPGANGAEPWNDFRRPPGRRARRIEP